jgi:hypothetical protein
MIELNVANTYFEFGTVNNTTTYSNFGRKIVALIVTRRFDDSRLITDDKK